MNKLFRDILCDIQSFQKNQDKDVILKDSIRNRLDKSTLQYYKEMVESLRYLSSKNELKVMKGINKESDQI